MCDDEVRASEAVQREDRKLEREREEQDQRDPERRHVVEEEARQDGRALADPASFPRDVATDEHAQGVFDDYGATEQEQGSGQGLGYDRRDGPPLAQRRTEVEREHVHDVAVELDIPWLIESEQLNVILQGRLVQIRVDAKSV